MTEQAQEVAKEQECRLSFHHLDVTDAARVEEVMSEIALKARHPVRGLVAAADIQQIIPAIDYDIAKFKRILDVNVAGVFLTAQGAARLFQQQGVSESIVIVANMSGTIANRVCHQTEQC